MFNVDIQAVGRCQQQGWHDEDGYGDGDFDDDNLSVHNLDIQAVGEGCCQEQGWHDEDGGDDDDADESSDADLKWTSKLLERVAVNNKNA